MKLLLSIFLLLTCYRSLSQAYSVSGTVVDEMKLPVSSAEIKVTNKDKFKRSEETGKDGHFSVRAPQAGRYRIVITAHGYDTYTDSVLIGNSTSAAVDLGVIRLTPTIHMLDEVKIVNKVIAMEQKDDTMEFNSAAYKVNPDADAADLVRKMPSIEVNGNTITAQGESVVKILVDGKPFFGDDPYASLKNLPADIIDKVQVYNEKSDEEQFTGFSEGSTSKTINIITKADKRNGFFGKLYGGYGSDNSDDGKYGAGGALNGFDGDRRITLTGQSNNVNIQDFTDPNAGAGGGGGITNTNAGGVSYTDKWGDKTDLSGSYFFNGSNTSVAGSLRKTYILPIDSGQVYSQSSASANRNYSHRFTARVNYKADSMNSLLWQPAYSLNNSSGSAQMQGGTVQGPEQINQTINSSSPNHAGYNIGNKLLYRHRFHKKGRTFSIDLNAANNNSAGANQHNAQNTYYTSPALSDTLDQQTLLAQNAWTAAGAAAYTEPAGEHGLLKLDYGVSYLPARSANNTYDYSYATDAYSLPDSVYSNSFYSRNTSHKAGGSYLYHAGKYEFSAGANYQLTELRNDQALPVSYRISRTFQNLLPVAMLRYKISKTKNLQINYSTNTQAPSVGQLQNVVNNINPLFLTTGNPYLKQPFHNNVALRYNSMNKEAKNTFSASVSGNYTQNGITANNIVAANDTLIAGDHIILPKGSQLSMPENISGNSAVTANLSYGMPLGAIKCNLKLSIDAGASHVPAIINNQVNAQDNRNGGFGASLSSNISGNVDFIISSNTSVVTSANSLNTQLNTTYVNESGKASANLIFWKGWVFNTNVTYQANSGISAGYNQDYVLWNMSIGRKIFKKRLGDIRLAVFDLLNDNSNIQHTITGTYIQDTRSTILQRYFLLVFTYKIRDFKK